MCRHYWIPRSLSRIQCRLCGLALERAESDGKWHDRMQVALRAAMRAVKPQAAPLA